MPTPRKKGPGLGWAAAALAAVALVGTAGTGATWVDRAGVPGGDVRTVEVRAPAPTCSGLRLSWSPVPGATRYVVLVAGLEVARLPGTSLTLSVGGLVTVEAVFGSWTSAASAATLCL